jgi:hypothetical protein
MNATGLAYVTRPCAHRCSIKVSMDDSNSEAPPRDSDQLLRRLVDCALEHAAFLLDCDGRVTWWSKGAERVFLFAGSLPCVSPSATAAAQQQSLSTSVDQLKRRDRDEAVSRDRATAR